MLTLYSVAMGAVADIWKSERGLLCLVIILASTVLAWRGILAVADWQQMIIYIFGTYVVGKTATGVASILKGQPADKGGES